MSSCAKQPETGNLPNMGRREGIDVYFRKKLRQERERRGWSQADVAKMLSDNGLPMYPTTVAKIEAGERGVRIDEAAGIADLLEVPLDWLVGRQASGQGTEIRYALRALQEKARAMVVDIALMGTALSDWKSDTSELSFEWKDEFQADCDDASHSLVETQMQLMKIVGRQLAEDEEDDQ